MARPSAVIVMCRRPRRLATGGQCHGNKGFRLSGRRPWTKTTRLKVAADEALDLAAAVGHNTSRFRPDAGPFRRGHGYRDVGTASLYRIARATTGLPID